MLLVGIHLTVTNMTPIAMKCSLEQWEAIKPKLKNVQISDVSNNFNNYCYLVNNYSGNLGIITNVSPTDKEDHNRTVYEEWNESIFLEACDIKPIVNEFKAGDYIVTLEGDFNNTRCAKENYCFKIRRSAPYMSVESTIISGIGDGNDTLKFDKSDNLKDWRYATPEEIAEYDRLDRPYDVTTLNKVKQWSVGTYVVFLKDNIEHNRLKKGDIERIDYFNGKIITYSKNFSNDISNLEFCNNAVGFATEKEAVEFSKQLLNQSNNFQLPNKWCCKLTIKNKDRFKAAYDKLVPKNTFYFGSFEEYYNSDCKVNSILDYTEITLEQMEKAAGISEVKGKDTSNVAFDAAMPQFPNFPTHPIIDYPRVMKESVNLTKPKLNRPKRKELNSNLIKPIKPVKL